jgi:hypothetical protein
LEIIVLDMESPVEVCPAGKTLQGIVIRSHMVRSWIRISYSPSDSEYFPFQYESMTYSPFISIIRWILRINFHYQSLPILPAGIQFHPCIYDMIPTNRPESDARQEPNLVLRSDGDLHRNPQES